MNDPTLQGNVIVEERFVADKPRDARILLADGNADMRDHVRRVLSEHYEVTAVADGQAALKAALAAPPDLVLTDAMTPGLDGFDLLRALRADPKTASASVVMLSERADEQARAEGLEAGADDYLSKPFNARELLARVRGSLTVARVRREAARREAELQSEHDSILNSVSDAIAAVGPDWRLAYVNAAAERILHKRCTELRGVTLWEAFPELVGTRFEQDFRRAMAERTVLDLEERIDEAGWFEVHASPSSGGGLTFFFRDVTQRKQAETLLSRQRDILQEIVQGAPLNDVLERICRSVEEQASSNLIATILLLDDDGMHLRPAAGKSAPADWTKAIDPLRIGPSVGSCGTAAFRGEAVVVSDISNDPLWDGFQELAVSYGLRACWSTPIFSSKRRVLGTFAIYYSEPHQPGPREQRLVELITRTAGLAIEQRRADEALRASERRFRTFADTAPAVLWVTDAEGRCTFLSSGWYELTGQQAGTGLGFGWLEATHPDDRERSNATFLAAKDRGEEFTLEYRLRRADGGYRWAIDAGRPLFNDHGEFIGHVGSVLDIHDRVEAEAARARLLEEAQQARADAEAANQMKDEFLATLSHELRTPLNAIVGWSSLLRRGKADAEIFEEGVDAIERNAKIQAQLIEDLLDVSRIISGKLRLEVQQVDLGEVIDGAIAAVAPAAEANGNRVCKSLASSDGAVFGDSSRLQQVVWNLLSNAVKFSPTGADVRVLLEQVDSHVEISVVDQGQGIKPEFLPHVFDRFRQADGSTTRSHGGLGLGLAIVKQLVELHGGSIRADSDGEGRGATFTVSLPITPTAASSGAQPESSRIEAGERSRRSSLKGVRALVIDDDRDARELIRRILQAREAEVQVASSAAEALEALERFAANILVSDIGMPGKDGYDLIREIRSGGRSAAALPAVALTAFARPEDRQKAMTAGFQSHITKPVEPTELVALLCDLTGRSEMRGL